MSEQLLRLQQTDRQLSRLARRHYALLQGRDRSRNLREVAQQHSREQMRTLRSTQERLSDLSWELEDLEVRLRELLAQQPGSGDHLLDREVVSLRQRRAQLEQQVIELMLKTDELSRQLPASRAEFARRADRLVRHEERLNALIARVERSIQEYDQRRQQLASLLPPTLLAAYEVLRPTTADQPLAIAVAGHCENCGAALSGPAMPPTFCPSCGRIIVLAPEAVNLPE